MAGDGRTVFVLVTDSTRRYGDAGDVLQDADVRRELRRQERDAITPVWAIHLSGLDEHRPLDAVVMAARRTKILRLVRLTEYPLPQ